MNGQQKVMQRLGRQLDAAHDAIREAERETGRALIRAATAEHQAATLAAELRPYRTAVEEHRRRVIAAGTLPAAHLGTPVPQHTGGNAEACPACTAHNPPYPFLCPAPSTPEQP